MCPGFPKYPAHKREDKPFVHGKTLVDTPVPLHTRGIDHLGYG